MLLHLVATEEGVKPRHGNKIQGGKNVQEKKKHLIETEEGVKPRHAAGRLGHGLDVLTQILNKSVP